MGLELRSRPLISL